MLFRAVFVLSLSSSLVWAESEYDFDSIFSDNDSPKSSSESIGVDAGLRRSVNEGISDLNSDYYEKYEYKPSYSYDDSYNSNSTPGSAAAAGSSSAVTPGRSSSRRESASGVKRIKRQSGKSYAGGTSWWVECHGGKTFVMYRAKNGEWATASLGVTGVGSRYNSYSRDEFAKVWCER